MHSFTVLCAGVLFPRGVVRRCGPHPRPSWCYVEVWPTPSSLVVLCGGVAHALVPRGVVWRCGPCPRPSWCCVEVWPMPSPLMVLCGGGIGAGKAARRRSWRQQWGQEVAGGANQGCYSQWGPQSSRALATALCVTHPELNLKATAGPSLLALPCRPLTAGPSLLAPAAHPQAQQQPPVGAAAAAAAAVAWAASAPCPLRPGGTGWRTGSRTRACSGCCRSQRSAAPRRPPSPRHHHPPLLDTEPIVQAVQGQRKVVHHHVTQNP